MESLTPTDEERSEFSDVLTTGHEGEQPEVTEAPDEDSWAPDASPYDDFDGDQDEVEQ